jgi:dethiobiotin synthetase
MKIPRIFIAATKQDEGKTTAALGALMHLQHHFSNVGFMKPVGQKFVELDSGIKVDKDVWLVREAFNFNDPAELMSPVTIPPGFTKKYISNRNPEILSNKITDAFVKQSQNKDFMLLEGTGHAGVGSVVDLSNARVAELLESPVIIVSSGGIGKPIDEIMLNVSLFKERGVKVAGVILNKVLPNKLHQIKDYAGKALAWHNLELLGVVPYVPLLSEPTLTEVCRKINGTVLSGENKLSTLYSNAVLAVDFSSVSPEKIKNKTLLVTTGRQTELLVACANENHGAENLRNKISGILLIDGIKPKNHILKMMDLADLPVIITEMSAFDATGKVSKMVAKTQPGNPEKVEKIEKLFGEYVNIEKIIEISKQ